MSKHHPALPAFDDVTRAQIIVVVCLLAVALGAIATLVLVVAHA